MMEADQPAPSPSSASTSSSSSDALSTKSEPAAASGSVPIPMTDNIAFLQVKWDPQAPEKEYPTETATRRINVEMMDCVRDPVEGIHLAMDESNITVMHALVVGPRDTPYEKGFFYFYIRIPPNYPWEPPRVKLMTTGNGKVRFNPNLYNCGKVCLSILGTWPGPSWTAALSVKSVLLSIQSIMNRAPFFNEPAYEGQEASVIYQTMSEEYTDNIRYETLRVAVLGMMEAPKTYTDCVHMPQVLKDKMREIFLDNIDFYTTVINDNLQSKLNYKSLQSKFAKLIEREQANAASGASSSKAISNGASSATTTKAKNSATTKKA